MRLKFSDDGGRPGAGGLTSRLKGIESGVNHFSRPDFCMSDNFSSAMLAWQWGQ